MAGIRISLVDNDYVVHAKAEMNDRKKDNPLLGLIRRIDEDFIHGEDAFLEIEGLKKGRIRLMVSQVEG